MRSGLGRVFTLAAAVLLACALSVSADTLKLKDGRVLHGKYVGGTPDTIQLEINGVTQTFNMADVQSFTKDSTTSDSPGLPDAPVAQPRAQEPAPAPAPSGPRVTVPAGTRILVRMIDGIDSKTNRTGDRFRASLESSIDQDGVIVAPRGADVYGRLVNAQEAGHISGHAELKLELTGILINNEVVPVVTGEYQVAGKGRGGNTAKKAAGGAALGAIIGAIAGGGKGAAIGAGAGAAAGTTINIVTRGEQVKVPSETLLEFRLDAPLSVTVPPAKNYR